MRDFKGLSKKHFDNQAAIYDETNTIYYSKLPKKSCENVAESLKSAQFDSLLDVGCGTGYLIELLKKQRKAEYHGLDISPEMLKQAKKKFDNSVFFAEGSADSLPYTDEQFDIVTCIQSFHHYPEPEKSLQEAYRVLKEDGVYIISDTGCNNIFRHLSSFIFRHFAKGGDYAAYSIGDIQQMLERAGFKVEKAEMISKYVFTVIAKKKK